MWLTLRNANNSPNPCVTNAFVTNWTEGSTHTHTCGLLLLDSVPLEKDFKIFLNGKEKLGVNKVEKTSINKTFLPFLICFVLFCFKLEAKKFVFKLNFKVNIYQLWIDSYLFIYAAFLLQTISCEFITLRRPKEHF